MSHFGPFNFPNYEHPNLFSAKHRMINNNNVYVKYSLVDNTVNPLAKPLIVNVEVNDVGYSTFNNNTVTKVPLLGNQGNSDYVYVKFVFDLNIRTVKTIEVYTYPIPITDDVTTTIITARYLRQWTSVPHQQFKPFRPNFGDDDIRARPFDIPNRFDSSDPFNRFNDL